MKNQAISHISNSQHEDGLAQKKRAEQEFINIKAAQAAIEHGTGYSSDKTLARYFDISRSTVWLWSKTGRLPKPKKLSEGTSRFENSKVKEAA